MLQTETHTLTEKISRLNHVGIALSVESNYDRLMELILHGAMELTNADGGTIYRIAEDSQLKFEVLINQTLQIAKGGTLGEILNFPMVSLFNEGQQNRGNVVSCCYHDDMTINIVDVYNTKNYDFHGTREFDKRSGYKTTSMLAVPMKNHEKDIIGVLQLINAKDSEGSIISFTDTDQQLAESLTSQAAVAITNKDLIRSLQNLFDSFVKLIATAIDEKSPYTGNHCRRIPILTMMLAEAVHGVKEGAMSDFKLNEADRLELTTAAWLHDCGKITSPDYIMDKSTKLECVTDKMEVIDLRLELKIHQLLIAGQEEQTQEIKDHRTFLRKSNIGGEFLDSDSKQRIKDISTITYINVDGIESPILTENEVYNLSISRGTLNPEERLIINNHMVATIKMLEALPFPKHLQQVPEYAGGHHEKMDGKGYPKGLTRDQMSVPARIMAIADIFEALTASDRPYKRGKKVSECLSIMNKMKEESHIDPELYDIFLQQEVWLDYAKKELKSEQLDIHSWKELA